jgi:acetyl-CoA carboxylase carboxyl transferase subunit alpha
MNFLEFEKPIADLFVQLSEAQELAAKSGIDMKKAIAELEQKIEYTRISIYQNLSPWQRVQVSRHPDRPYALSYINYMTDGNFQELHGDRTVKDDKAMIGGIGCVDGKSIMFIGQQKGANTKQRQYRNFGMANPEGYRKALRLMKMAEKFDIPIVTLIDTPGAYPGLEAEERGQGEAIARNLFEMTKLKVPVVCIIIGEGASGGALGIGIGDKVLMLENTWYSVISPESCSSILWRSWDYKEKASVELKLTAEDMMRNKLIDGVIKEPIGGAHTHYDQMFRTVKTEVIKELAKLSKIKPEKRIEARIAKFSAMGAFTEK